MVDLLRGGVGEQVKLISDVYDVTILSYLNSTEYKKFTDFVKRQEFKRMPNKENIRKRLVHLHSQCYIELDPNNSAKGRLTEEGTIFYMWILNVYILIRDCFKAKWYKSNWSKTRRVTNSFIDTKFHQILDYLVDHGYIEIKGQSFSQAFREYETTSKGDIFAFTNIIQIENPIMKLWKIKEIRGWFDFTKPKGKSWDDIVNCQCCGEWIPKLQDHKRNNVLTDRKLTL